MSDDLTTIWKWTVPVQDEFTIEAPKGAVFVETVRAITPTDIELWAEVDPEQPLVPRRFVIVGTGNPMPRAYMLRRLGAAFGGQFVWHVYEARS